MRGGTPPPSTAGASGGHICEDAPVLCCTDKCENKSESNSEDKSNAELQDVVACNKNE